MLDSFWTMKNTRILREFLIQQWKKLYKEVEPKAEGNYIEYRGSFLSGDNKNKILDLFDAYYDIQEILLKEGLKPSC